MRAVLALRHFGMSLAEILVVLAFMAILSAIVLPHGASQDPHKLELVAQEAGSLLRLAVSEARRTGNGLASAPSYVLIDGKTVPGTLRLYNSSSTAQLTSAIKDPLTKSEARVDPARNALAQGVVITPQFKGGGQPWTQLLITTTAGASQFTAFDGVATSKGSLEPGSSVLLTLGAQTVTVAIDPQTGLVSRP